MNYRQYLRGLWSWGTHLSLRFWESGLGRPTSRHTAAKRRRRATFCPQLELLETRLTPSQVPLTVTITQVGEVDATPRNFYAAVTINGVEQDNRAQAQYATSFFPDWSFTQQVDNTAGPIPVSIELLDRTDPNPNGLFDTILDLDPEPAHQTIDLQVNPLTGVWSGDVKAPTNSDQGEGGGADGPIGNLSFDISMPSTDVAANSFPLNSQSWTAIDPGAIFTSPPPVNSFGASPPTVSGRVTGLAVDSRTDTIYAATAGGGVWKDVSNSGGTNADSPAGNSSGNWINLTDNIQDAAGNPIPEFMGAIAVAPSNPSVIYAGTGEANNSGDSNWGEGILVSTNGGAPGSWRLTGQATFQGTAISQIVIDPHDFKTVWAAVSNQPVNGNASATTGIYETTDGGNSWFNTTAAIDTVDPWSAVVIDPTTTTFNGGKATLFAAVGNQGGSASNGVYESIDSGKTWNTAPLPVTFFPGRIALALSHPTGNKNATVYASIATVNVNGSSSLQAFDVSTDGGTTWTQQTKTPNYLTNLGWYGNVLVADPNTATTVYAAGAGSNSPTLGTIQESTDGGKTWTDISTDSNSVSPHADNHALVVDGQGRLLDGNDGGVWRLDSNLPSLSWEDLNGWETLNSPGLSINQITGIALNPTSSQMILSGSQDNGTNLFLGGQGGTFNSAWTNVAPNDGGYVRIDPTDTNPSNPITAFTTYQYPTTTSTGTLTTFERIDGLGSTNTLTNISGGISSSDNPAPFYPPYVIDPNNPQRLVLGTNKLYVTTDQGGSSGGDWSILGTFPTKNLAIDSIAIAPSDPTSNTMYVSAGNGGTNKLYVTTDGGKTWSDRTPAIAFGSTFISSQGVFQRIAVSPTSSGTAYVIVSAFTTGNVGEVWQTTNYGVTWTDITGSGLPNVPIDSIALVPSVNAVVVGTDVGVYATTNVNGSKTAWARVGTGLPNVQVTDLQTATYTDTGTILAAGTHGRGVWEIQVSPTVQVNNGVVLLSGTAVGSNFSVQLAPGDPNSLQVYQAGSLRLQLPTSAVNRIQVSGLGGSNTLTLDFANGNFIPSGGISYDGGPTGPNSLIVQNGSGLFTNEVETITSPYSGTIQFDANAAITYTNVDSIDDTVGASSYKVVDAIPFSGQELGVADPSSPLGPNTTAITGLATYYPANLPFAPLYVDNKNSITVTGPAAQTTFDATLINPNLPVTLQGQSGQDTFNVNYAVNPQNTITVTDTGTAQRSTLNINDQTNSDNQGGTYDIRANQIERTGFSGTSGGGLSEGTFDDVIIAYSNIGTLDINGGNNGYVYNVRSTAPGTYTQIVPGSSLDSVNVIPDPQALDTVISSLFIDSTANGGGPPSLILDDTGLARSITGSPFTGFSTATLQSATYLVSDGEVQRTATYEEKLQNLLGTNDGVSHSTSTVDVRYASLSRLTVKDTAANTMANAFTVVSTGGTAQTVLALQHSNDTVQVGLNVPARFGPFGDAFDLEHINNVNVQGTPGSTLTIDDEADQATFPRLIQGVQDVDNRVSDPGYPTFTLNAGSVTFANQGTDTITGQFAVASTITYSNIGSLIVQGSSQLNTGNLFNVLATNTPTTIKAGSNGDTVHAGDPRAGLDNIAATLTVTGTGNTNLVLDDTGKHNRTFPFAGQERIRQTNAIAYVVNAGNVTRTNQIVDTLFDSSDPELNSVSLPLITNNFVYSGLAGVTIEGGPTGNHFSVPITDAEPITINAGTAIPGDPLNPGKDVVDVGSGVLDTVVSLMVNGGTATVVNLNDQATASDSSYSYFYGGSLIAAPDYMITASSVTRTNRETVGRALFADYVTTVGYKNVSQLTINGGHSGNRFLVEGTAAGTQLTINDGSPLVGDPLNTGTNTVDVGSSSLNADSTLDPILGPVTVNGQGGTDTLDVLDGGAAPRQGLAYAITSNSISRTGTATITYHGITAVNVQAVNAGSNGFFNELNVTSTAAGTAYQLYTGTGLYLLAVFDTGYTINGIQGALALHGAGGSSPNDDLVEIYDLDTAAHHTFQVNAGTSAQSGVVQRFNAAGQTDAAPISYDGINAYTVLNTAGSIGATINVQSLAPNLYTIIEAGTPDTIHVGNASHTLGAIQGDLRIQGVLGQTPTVTVDDAADASARPIDMGNDPSNGYLVNGLLPPSSTGYGNLWFSLDPAAPVSITTGARNFHLHDLTGAPAFALNGGGGSLDTGTAGLAGNFDHTLSLADFSTVSLHVLGDWSGSLLASTVGTPAAPIGPLVIDGAMTASGKIKVGALSSLTVGGDLAGTVYGYANSGSQSQPTIGTVTIGGNFTGNITAPVIGSILMTPTSTFSGTALETTPGADFQSLVLGTVTSTAVIDAGAIVNATVAGDMAGQINVSGPLGTLAVGGTLSGSVTAQSLAGLSVTKDLTGQVSVTGTLGPVSVAGNTSGSIAAGQLTSVASPDAHGPVVLDFTEGGVERRLLATPVDGSSLDAVSFSYSVDATGPGDPRLTVHVTNADPVHDRFDLSLTSSSAAAGFDLAQLDSPMGPSGIRDVAIDGNLLAGGISLPQDHLGSVAVWGQAAAGAIQAGSVEAVAFGSVVETSRTVAATDAGASDALQMLDSQTGLAQANDTFRVPFADGLPVAFFMDTQAHDHHFDTHDVLFTDQAANDPRGAVTALVTVTVPVNPGGQPGHSTIQTIALRGDGGAIQTSQVIAQAITSTGPLGDLILTAAGGLAANVTAPSIIGNIEVQGLIAGTIQTTGIRTDPITGSTSTIAADWGMITGGAVPSTTVVQAQGGGITGQLISRGNFLSRIVTDAGISGVIAAQGNIGTTVGTTRLGGILSHGPLQGEIVTLGYLIGDVEIDGGLKGGRIAAKLGIPGNLLINGGLDAASAIVAGGEIGDAVWNTFLTVHGDNKGIIAAEGIIRSATGALRGLVYDDVGATLGNPNAAAIDAIFTNNGAPLSFDMTGLDLAGLNLILTDLESLTVGPDGNLKGPKP